MLPDDEVEDGLGAVEMEVPAAGGGALDADADDADVGVVGVEAGIGAGVEAGADGAVLAVGAGELGAGVGELAVPAGEPAAVPTALPAVPTALVTGAVALETAPVTPETREEGPSAEALAAAINPAAKARMVETIAKRGLPGTLTILGSLPMLGTSKSYHPGGFLPKALGSASGLRGFAARFGIARCVALRAQASTER